MAKRINPLAPYFVQMRELERRLLNGALVQVTEFGYEGLDDRVNAASGLLGVEPAYFRVRARVLGGVLDNEPKCEPPKTTATQAWGKEAGRTRAQPRRPRRKLEIVPDEPKTEEPSSA